MKKVYLFFLLLLALQSCKPKLNEQQAQQLIVQAFSFPIQRNTTYYTGDVVDREYTYGVGSITGPDDLHNFHFLGNIALKNQGYMTIRARIDRKVERILLPNEVWIDTANEGTMAFNVHFTDNAKPYILKTVPATPDATANEVRVAEVGFGNLISLREVNDNQYEAEFSLTQSLTPLGEVYNQGVWGEPVKNLNSNDLQNLKVQFYRYDKGWNVSSDDIQKIKNLFQNN